MTERKPPGVDFESWVEKQIREAQERGEFDELPGAGKPLSGVDRDWLSTYLEREGLSSDPVLPEPLRLRKEVERLADTTARLRREDDVRAAVRELNVRIAAWMRSGEGPRIHVAPVDVEEVVLAWREARSSAHPEQPIPEPPEPQSSARARAAAERGRRRPWWRRWWRRS